MIDDDHGQIHVVLVTAGRQSAASALGTARSVVTANIGVRVVVLATAPVAATFAEFDVLPIDGVLPTGSVASGILDDADLLAFAEPFAMESLVDRYGAVVSVAAGVLVTGRFSALEKSLVEQPFVLTAPVVCPPPDTNLPRLTLRDSEEALSRVAVAARRGDRGSLRQWQQTMVESLLDPNLEAPRSFRDGALASQLGDPKVAVEGHSTVINWADWAGMMSRGVPIDEAPSIIDATELWSMLDDSSERVGGEMTETEYRLVDLRLHDAEPLLPLLDIMTGALADVGDNPAVTPFERMTRAIRRACDPMGVRWPIGDSDRFAAWLYEANPSGVTRIADLHWYANREARERFSDARTNSGGYLRWCREKGREALGFDLLDPRFEAVTPVSQGDAPAPSGWTNALMWRWNVIKGVIPGVAAAGERRDRGLDVVSGPEAGRGTAPPTQLRVDRRPSPWGVPPRPLTLIGCLRAESGLGQASRASLRALRALEIPFTHIDTSEKYPSRNGAEVGLDWSNFAAIGDVNLIHANALEIIKMNDTVFRHRLGGRFNAAMWFWEAGNLPEWKLAAFDRIDELWVASSYLVDVLGQYGKVPVHNVGLATPLPADRVVDRESFGIGADEFVFLFVYDALSSHGRKNPELALEAFIDAFGPDFANVRFIVKASNLNKLPVDRERLMALAASTPAITVIDRYLDHEAVYDLMATADAYVSLHAAEGYGLTILEAMSLGTPAICTGYSGNMDFTTAENSWLVDYELIRTDEIAGPYPKGSIWALPDREHAAMLMRRAASHPAEVAAKAEVAKQAAVEAASLDRYAGALSENLRRVL